MISELTAYLFKYKTVAIPGIGTFTLSRQQPVADRSQAVLIPPTYGIDFSGKDAVSTHQSATLHHSGAADLSRFGAALQQHLQVLPFTWQGLGQLSQEANGSLTFEPQLPVMPYLQPLIAENIVRADVTHTVLVGENELEKTVPEPVVQRRRSLLWIGWVVLALALGAAAYLLYTKHFTPSGAGLQQKVKNKAF